MKDVCRSWKDKLKKFLQSRQIVALLTKVEATEILCTVNYSVGLSDWISYRNKGSTYRNSLDHIDNLISISHTLTNKSIEGLFRRKWPYP